MDTISEGHTIMVIAGGLALLAICLLIEDQDGTAERPREQPGALLRGAHPRIRPTTTASTTKRTISATTGAKLSAKPPLPTEGTTRRKRLR